MGFIFFGKVVGWGSATSSKMCSLTSIFQAICSSDLLLPIKTSWNFRKVYFPKNLLVAAVNHCKVFKTFIPAKIMYLAPDIRV